MCRTALGAFKTDNILFPDFTFYTADKYYRVGCLWFLSSGGARVTKLGYKATHVL